MKLKQIVSVFSLSLFVFTACQSSKTNGSLLPVIGPKKVVNNDTVYHTVGNFELFNQYGEKITGETVKGKIYVADFFFTTCQSICPRMSTNLTGLQKMFENDDSLLILSHSVNPLHDTVEVLRKYAESYGAIKGKWHLLTGKKSDIYSLAKKDYLVNALEDDGTPEGFLHSEVFLLIDTKGRIRGLYDGTDELQVLQLAKDIKLLKTEKP